MELGKQDEEKLAVLIETTTVTTKPLSLSQQAEREQQGESDSEG